MRMVAFSIKIDEMEKLTQELQRRHALDSHFLDVQKELRKHRDDAKPYEVDMDESALEGLLECRGLDSSGTRDEKLQRLLHYADYFYDDHKKTMK